MNFFTLGYRSAAVDGMFIIQQLSSEGLIQPVHFKHAPGKLRVLSITSRDQLRLDPPHFLPAPFESGSAGKSIFAARTQRTSQLMTQAPPLHRPAAPDK